MRPEAETLKRWRDRPDIFVRELFHVVPDAWQDEALRAFPTSPRLALKACKGPGKTAVLAWIGWNFLLTRDAPMCGATSISGDNLKANLWTELARWRERTPLLTHAFEQTKTEIFLRESPRTHKLEARTWAKDADATQIGNALAGVHAPYVLWLLDESGDYPDAIMPTAEAIFSGNPIEAHIVQAGNPTRLSGPLYRACTTSRHLWTVIEITGDPDDPQRSPRIPVEHAREQIRQYGRDNPWVLVNIFGQFPPAAFNALLGQEDIEAAMRRKYQQSDIAHAAKILGVDVALYGDDASVIFPRQGLVAFKPHIMRNVDSLVGAGQVCRVWQDWGVDAVFIDNTGGFGAGWIDQCRLLNRQPLGVHFSSKPLDKRYFNKRSEIYFNCAQWIRNGGALPSEDPSLFTAFTQTTYTFKGDALMIEPKDMVKAKIGRSPDPEDALCLTHSEPVASKAIKELLPRHRAEKPYDPFADYVRT